MAPSDERRPTSGPLGPEPGGLYNAIDAWVGRSAGVGWPHPTRLHIFVHRPTLTQPQTLLPEEQWGKLLGPPCSFWMSMRHGAAQFSQTRSSSPRNQASLSPFTGPDRAGHNNNLGHIQPKAPKMLINHNRVQLVTMKAKSRVNYLLPGTA